MATRMLLSLLVAAKRQREKTNNKVRKIIINYIWKIESYKRMTKNVGVPRS